MKIKEATITISCSNPNCEEELILDIGDPCDISLLSNRVKNELAHERWKLFGIEELPFCSNQCLLKARF